MASPFSPLWPSKSADNKRKASALLSETPLRRRDLDPNLDALDRCYETDQAIGPRWQLAVSAAERILAMDQEEAVVQKRTAGANDHIGAARDEVMANLRLLHQAKQRLTAHSTDESVQRGKEKFSMSEILPISGDLIKLGQLEAEREADSLERNDATLLQRDQLIKQLKVAQQERDNARAECDSLRNQRDQKQIQVEEVVETSKEARMQSSSSNDLGKASASTYNEAFGSELADKREVEEMQAELDKLRCTLNHKRQIYESELKDAYLTKEKELNEAQSKMLSDGYAAKNEMEQFHAELGKLQSTLDQERQASTLKSAALESASTISATVLKRVQDKITDVLNIPKTQLESDKSQQKELSGKRDGKLSRQQTLLEKEHDGIVRGFSQGWQQEKARLLTSATAGRSHVVLAESNMKAAKSASLRNDQSESAANNQRVIRDLVTVIAVSHSSYNELFSAYGKKDRIVHTLTGQIQRLEQQLTCLQDRSATQMSESNRLQMELRGKKEELDKLCAENKANVKALDEIRLIHTVCEQDKRLQLGRTNRDTFFDDFLEFAGSQSNMSIIFKGQESGRDIDVCLCVMADINEALCLIRRLDGAFTIWYGKLEDCSWNLQNWQIYVSLGREDQGTPIHILPEDTIESKVWLFRNVPEWKASDTEVARQPELIIVED